MQEKELKTYQKLKKKRNKLGIPCDFCPTRIQEPNVYPICKSKNIYYELCIECYNKQENKDSKK